ncbi:MAG: hypothetical protein UW28_C0004G0012 [Parcubacteria group bacterium GW2011_GWA2_44_13]|nr:MAG: hypothetical protein UW28_C0004G0012 [Parcubacteria group bacterium GW2011_GWA2_44_13]
MTAIIFGSCAVFFIVLGYVSAPAEMVWVARLGTGIALALVAITAAIDTK